jgi:NAD(P)H-dependent flavin oxidoreductase YrpB (nitropropane dioxygenase family)
MGLSGSTSLLATAVSTAGGLGTASIPCMSRDPEESAHLLREQVRYIARHAEKPFAVDVPVGRISSGEAIPSRRHTCRCYAR